MDASSLRKTFEDAHAADSAAHADDVTKILGTATSLGKELDEIWPKAVPVLTAVANLARYIPGVGTAAPVINGLIAVGNAIYKETSSTSSTS